MNKTQWVLQAYHLVDRVLSELQAQFDKWGVQQHSPERYLAILSEEVGEAAKAVVQGDIDDMRHQLIEVAAVALAMAAHSNDLRQEWPVPR